MMQSTFRKQRLSILQRVVTTKQTWVTTSAHEPAAAKKVHVICG